MCSLRLRITVSKVFGGLGFRNYGSKEQTANPKSLHPQHQDLNMGNQETDDPSINSCVTLIEQL